MGFEDWLYGLNGERITEDRFHELAQDPAANVARDRVGGFHISTQWSGISAYEPPMVYETVVFDHNGVEVERVRYPNRAAAERGHATFVEEYRRSHPENGHH